MNKFFLFFVVMILQIPIKSDAQVNAKDVATVAGGLAVIGATIAAINQMKERAELTATEWLLKNHPEMNNFSLKTLSFEGKELKDMSAVSVIIFKIQEFIPSDHPKLI